MLPGDVLEDIFSELKESESEDEKIRKELIRTFKSLHTIKLWHGIERTDIIAWLEKQHKQKDSVVDFKAKDWYVSNVDGKIHNMHYSVDKIEPKFKVGDWIVTKANNLYQVTAIIDDKYQLKYRDNYTVQKYIDVDKNARLWNIEAAIEAHAKEYSFNIESMLFPQLTKEQQKLWRKEIEQACISGGMYILSRLKTN